MPTKHQHPTSKDNSAAKASFVDITKLTKEWGGDDTTEANSLYIWAEASRNYTNAFKSLSADANDLNPHTYGGELEKHFDFFKKSVDDAEELFEVWYGTEKELRNKIITARATFELNFWHSKVQGVVLAHKAAKLVSSSSSSFNSLRLSDVGKPPSSQNSRSSSSNREGQRERGGGRRDRDRFRDHSRDRFRDHSRDRSRERNDDRRHSTHRNSGSQGGDSSDSRPTICVICGEEHRVRFHPPAKKCFADGKPHFATYVDGKLKIANPQQDRDTEALCVAFNLLWDCDGSHKSKGRHICSFCGGDHAALSFHRNCHRARNGKFRY
jgi:hypothetical protein